MVGTSNLGGKPPFSYGFSDVFPISHWFSYGFPMGFEPPSLINRFLASMAIELGMAYGRSTNPSRPTGAALVARMHTRCGHWRRAGTYPLEIDQNNSK